VNIANVISSTSGGSKGTSSSYEELKRRLLGEYKKLCTNKKSFDDQVREKYKNIKQRASSGKKVSGAPS
jgi:molybdenum-dependent DNA-binding transcriptional regulator ModE